MPRTVGACMAMIVTTVALCTALHAALPTVSSAQAPSRASAGSAAQSASAVSLKQDMRKLWTHHVVWTRDYIIAAVGDQPDAKAAANRLMKNQGISVTPWRNSTARRRGSAAHDAVEGTHHHRG
jgi:hypothetical protein